MHIRLHIPYTLLGRGVTVYLLKAKNQVYQFFQKFHALVERETGKFLKCLRTDNGGEYT